MNNLLDASFSSLDHILKNAPSMQRKLNTSILYESFLNNSIMNESLGILDPSMMEQTLCSEIGVLPPEVLDNSRLETLPLDLEPEEFQEHVKQQVNKLLKEVEEREKRQKELTKNREPQKLVRSASLNCLNKVNQTPVKSNPMDSQTCGTACKVDNLNTQNHLISSLQKVQGKFKHGDLQSHDMSTTFNLSKVKSASFDCIAYASNEDLTTVNVNLEDSIPSEDEFGLPRLKWTPRRISGNSPNFQNNLNSSQIIAGSVNDHSLESNDILSVVANNISLTPTGKMASESFCIRPLEDDHVNDEELLKETKPNSTKCETKNYNNDTFEIKEDHRHGDSTFDIKIPKNDSFVVNDEQKCSNSTFKVESANHETILNNSTRITPKHYKHRRTNSNPDFSFTSASQTKERSDQGGKMLKCFMKGAAVLPNATSVSGLTLKKMGGGKREGCDPVKAADPIEAFVKRQSLLKEQHSSKFTESAEIWKKPLRRSISSSNCSLNSSLGSFDVPLSSSTPESKNLEKNLHPEKKSMKTSPSSNNCTLVSSNTSKIPNIKCSTTKVPPSKLKGPSIKLLPKYQNTQNMQQEKSQRKSPVGGNHDVSKRLPISTIQKTALGDSTLTNRQMDVSNIKSLSRGPNKLVTHKTALGDSMLSNRQMDVSAIKNTSLAARKSVANETLSRTSLMKRVSTNNTTLNRTKPTLQLRGRLG